MGGETYIMCRPFIMYTCDSMDILFRYLTKKEVSVESKVYIIEQLLVGFQYWIVFYCTVYTYLCRMYCFIFQRSCIKILLNIYMNNWFFNFWSMRIRKGIGFIWSKWIRIVAVIHLKGVDSSSHLRVTWKFLKLWYRTVRNHTYLYGN